MLLQYDLNHIHKVSFYPSNNNFTQALLVSLVTNMISDDNDNDDDGPPHRWRWWCWGQWSSCWWRWMIEGMMTIVRLMVLQMRPKSPPFVHQPKSSPTLLPIMWCIVLLLPPIKPNGPSLSLLPIEAYSPPTQLRPNLNASPHMARQILLRNKTIQYKYKVTAVDATQQGPDCAPRLRPDVT